MSDVPARRQRNAPAPLPRYSSPKRQSSDTAAQRNTKQDSAEKEDLSEDREELYDENIVNGAQTQIQHEQRTGGFPDNIVNHKQIEENVLNFRFISRIEHIRSIALAYAFTIYSQNNEVCKAYIDGLRAKRKKRNSRTTNLHLVVESFISYGDGPGEDKNKNARKLYNRDVQAIKYLINQGIRPDKVEEHARSPNQGLDAWARALNQATLKKDPKTVDAEKLANIGDEDYLLDDISDIDNKKYHTKIVEVDNSEIKSCAKTADRPILINWINADGEVNKLILRPGQHEDYEYAQELILGLDLIYSKVKEKELF